MSYKFHADEQVWQETVFDEEMDCINGGRTTDIVDNSEGYFWITSTDRDEVLKVMDFPQGEDIITDLREGNLDSFEEVTGSYEYTEIMEERPPYGE